jgi:hypothetical protein
MQISDLKINSGVRSVLSRHWIDLQRVSYASFRGNVRLQGELGYLGGRGAGQEISQFEKIEQEIRRVPGVTRVTVDLDNVERSKTGKWELVRRAAATLT